MIQCRIKITTSRLGTSKTTALLDKPRQWRGFVPALTSIQYISTVPVTSKAPRNRSSSVVRFVRTTTPRDIHAQNPSINLVQSLRQIGRFDLLPQQAPWKVDLSFINANAADKKRFKYELLRRRIYAVVEKNDNFTSELLIRQRSSPRRRTRLYLARSILLRRDNEAKLKLSSILAKYIQCSNPRSAWRSSHIRRPPNNNSQAWKTKDAEILLASKGYHFEDVESWSAILLADDITEASERLLLHSPSKVQGLVKPLPTFVPLFLLCQNRIHKTALQNIIAYFWNLVDHKYSEESNQVSKCLDRGNKYLNIKKYLSIDDSSLFIGIVRLMRHARQKYPTALIAIAAIFIKAFRLDQASISPNLNRGSNEINRAKLVKLCNRTLKLLSIPSSIRPFASCTIHQRAQFDILGAMAKACPPIDVSREGYRAIIQMQLVSKKTKREIDWAQLKARSWPPWKEDKTGMDTGKDVAYGTSKALKAIHRACEAGYGNKLWEKTAKILTGWDLDGSPTIQTRTFLRDFYEKGNSNLKSQKDLASEKLSIMVWITRIRATRTVQEAWACFLAYESLRLVPHSELYLAMFEKLFYEKKRRHHETIKWSSNVTNMNEILSSPLTAGDGKEVMAASVSPRESMYVQVEAPSLEELADRMFFEDVHPSPRCLAFLISHAKTFDRGLAYIRNGCRGAMKEVSCLLSDNPALEEELLKVPKLVFAAYISLLCRFPCGSDGPSRSEWHFSSKVADRYHLFLAYQLLQSESDYTPAWFPLLTALIRDMKPYRGKPPTVLHSFRTYIFLHRVLQQMDERKLHDISEYFMATCRAQWFLTLSAICSAEPEASEFAHPKQMDGVDSTFQNQEAFYIKVKNTLELGSTVVQRAFCLLIGAEKQPQAASDQSTTVFHIPHPVHFHVFFRTLGILRDWDGILLWIDWMVKRQYELDKITEQARNGYIQLRRTLIAIRVFLERSWIVQDTIGARNSETSYAESHHRKFRQNGPLASDEVRLRAKNMIESVETWGGWPTDEEVDEYCENLVWIGDEC